MLEDVISEPGEIFDHRYVHMNPVLWQRHQSRILAKISIKTPDVVDQISSLDVTHRKISFTKVGTWYIRSHLETLQLQNPYSNVDCSYSREQH